MVRFLILGAGFTGSRVARRLRARGCDVSCTDRSTFDALLQDSGGIVRDLTPDTVVLHSIPTLRTAEGLWEATPSIARALAVSPPRRIVYLSTTGIYGGERDVNEHNAPAPRTLRERLRMEAETAVAEGPWSHLILRPAAIYGPGRGMHAAMRAGTFRLSGDGDNFISRIHVDDLASHAEAALLSEITGAFPVADERPCTSREAAEFCAKLLGVPLPPSAPPESLDETRRADRRVDGSAIRRLLGIGLSYPSYREGFPACIAEEARAFSTS